MFHFMWIYRDAHATGLILYYVELCFNYTESVWARYTARPLSSQSFCLILVQAICYKRGSNPQREADI